MNADQGGTLAATSDCVTALALRSGELEEGGDGKAFVVVGIDAH
ncbi:MAG: hypothetical protein O9289_18220 [Rhodobacteraceae bacterium]|nr:hypothetical protein [Paracoccaceae bacterium]